MNGPRFNHFFHYLLDLHNLKVEGKLRQLANPHNEERMKLILRLKTEGRDCEDQVKSNKGEDEVSYVYYGGNCNCSKQSKCRTSKCLCFLRDKKCSPECHDTHGSKCANK